MTRETTPQDRAAAIVDKVKSELTPIWLGGRQRMLLKREIAEALQATRRAAMLEAAQQVCMHCGKRAIGLQVGVTGPNVAGNYVHNPPEDSRVKESALCSATSIWSLIRYEDRLAQEGS